MKSSNKFVKFELRLSVQGVEFIKGKCCITSIMDPIRANYTLLDEMIPRTDVVGILEDLYDVLKKSEFLDELLELYK